MMGLKVADVIGCTICKLLICITREPGETIHAVVCNDCNDELDRKMEEERPKKKSKK